MGRVTIDIYGLRAFEDNYIWCLRQGKAVAVVDPGDATPVLAHLDATGAHLSAILVTHHHRDHTGGIGDLRRHGDVPVFAPATEEIAGTTQALAGGECITVPGIDMELEVIDVAGHTRGHVAYYGRGVLFCGDTMFGCGCGRLFEGTPAQMHVALTRIAKLPADTAIYCAHEYTQSGLRFAAAVEPDNASLPARRDKVGRQLADGQPSVPFSLADELATSPFLRCHVPAVARAAADHAGHPLTTPLEVFAALRHWRDVF
jgi:hydroxyacylglutathione hydrolase